MMELNPNIQFYSKIVGENLASNHLSQIHENITTHNYTQLIKNLNEIHKNRKKITKSDYDIVKSILPYTNDVSIKYKIPYINASIIKNNLGKTIIAAQQPKEKYNHLFVEFIKKSKTDLLVALVPIKNDYLTKSHKINNQRRNGNHENIETSRENSAFIEENFNLDGQMVHRIQYTNWPDMGIPSKKEFEKLLSKIKKINYQTMVVHCMVGVGRTGTLIHGYLCDMIETKSDFEAGIMMAFLRTCRPYMIFTPEQAAFCISRMRQKAEAENELRENEP